MKFEWKEIELSEVITDIAAGPFGSNLKVSNFVPYGFPIIDGANLKGFKVTDNVTKFVTEEKARSLSRSIAKRGDVVVTISGTLGQIAYIPQDSKFPEYLCSQRQFRVSFDESRVYVPYLVFYFHTYEGQNKILAFANQTGVPALSQPLKNFKKIVVTLPDLDEQKKIAGIIECLNDKIELNNKINNNLEQQIQALFIAWFVNFIPFSGKIPDDWKNIPFSDFLVQSKEKSDNPNIPMYSVTDTGIFPRSEKFKKVLSMTRAKNKVIRQTDLVFGMSREILNWGIMRDPEGGVSSAYNVYHVDKSVNSFYLESYIKSNISLFKDLIKPASREGQGIDKNALMQKTLLLPTKEVLDKYYEMENAFTRTISQVQEENKNLTEIRDTLLPKLMAGEIDVEGVKI